MKRIEIVEESTEKETDTVKFTSEYLKELIKNRGVASVSRSYQIPEEFILKNLDIFPKEMLIGSLSLSEDFIIEALKVKYFTKDDISKLSIKTYSQLSEDFIKKYTKSLNWSKIMVYLISSEKVDDMEKYVPLIKKHDLWKIVSSSGNLPIAFIRKYADRLDWNVLVLTQNFNEEESKEFSLYIQIVKSNFSEDEFIPFTEYMDLSKDKLDNNIVNLFKGINSN